MRYRVLFILSLFTTLLWGQGDYLKLEWDPNPQPDVTWYYIYRDNGIDVFVLIDSVRHPTSVYYDYNVEPGIRYVYKIQAKNTAGLFSGFSESRTGMIDPVALSISASGDSVQIEWTTPQPYQTQLVYDTQYPPQTYTPLQSSSDTLHRVILTGLQTGVPYFLSGLAPDGQGNLIATGDTSFILESDSVIVPFDSIPELPIVAYPNPVRQEHSGVYFDGVKDGVSIYIFNLVGELIWKGTATNTNRLFWDVKTNTGGTVSSGIYVYVVKDRADKKQASGKIVVLR